jgi:hypothetical protein
MWEPHIPVKARRKLCPWLDLFSVILHGRYFKCPFRLIIPLPNF